MLPVESQDRLLDALPDAYRLRIDGNLYERAINKWWAHEDRDDEYPAIELEIEAAGILRENQQPLDQVIRRLPVDGDETIAHNKLRGERVYDECRVRTACQGQERGVSAARRARLLTRQLTKSVRFGLDHLNSSGGYNEIPMRVEMMDPAADTSSLVADQQVNQWEFGIRINYTVTQDVLVDAVADTDIDYITIE